MTFVASASARGAYHDDGGVLEFKRGSRVTERGDSVASLRVLLAEINGKQDVTNERLKTVKDDLSSIKNEVTDVRATVASHTSQISEMRTDLRNSAETALKLTALSVRTSALEQENSVKRGHREGLAWGAKILWMITGGVPFGLIGAILMKLYAH